jgi:predicted nucleic acid-binding protein
LILFTDTSALLKLYVDEPGSAEMARAAADAAVIAVCRITWVEMMSAFARRAREQPSARDALAQASGRFTTDWPQLLTVEVTQPLMLLAGDYAEAFALRAYDSVQLAALQTLRVQAADVPRFACFDTRLVKAAQVLGVPAY